jgi:hypothetical protein
MLTAALYIMQTLMLQQRLLAAGVPPQRIPSLQGALGRSGGASCRAPSCSRALALLNAHAESV